MAPAQSGWFKTIGVTIALAISPIAYTVRRFTNQSSLTVKPLILFQLLFFGVTVQCVSTYPTRLIDEPV